MLACKDPVASLLEGFLTLTDFGFLCTLSCFSICSLVPFPFMYLLFLYIIGFSIRALSLAPLFLGCLISNGRRSPGGALPGSTACMLPLLVLFFPQSHVLLALMPFSSCCPVIQIRAYPVECRLLLSMPKLSLPPYLSPVPSAG